MGAINTAAYLAKIRGRMDAQQQVISMLETELQKAILGGGNKAASVLFAKPGDSTANVALANPPTGTINGLPAGVTYTAGTLSMTTGANGKYDSSSTTSQTIGLVKEEVPGATLVPGTGPDSPLNTDGNPSIPALYYLPRNEDTNANNDLTTYAATTPGSIYEIYDKDGLESFGAMVVDAMRKGASSDGEAFDLDSSTPVDQDALRQLLAQARSLLGELRIEEQAWNGEVNSEKTLRKEVNDFAKV